MASRTITTMTDDLDGSEATETIAFAFEGKSLEVDLSSKNADKFRRAMQPFVDVARKTGGSPVRGRRASQSDIDPKAVRAWAASNGIEVNSRGRIPAEVVARFKAAGN